MKDTAVAELAKFDAVQRWSGKYPPMLVQLAFGIGCALVAIAIRSLIDLVAPAAGPYALLYPAVLISTLFGRWRAGFVTYVAWFLWTLLVLLPNASALGSARPDEVSRTIINGVTALVVLIFAELFRMAVRRATASGMRPSPPSNCATKR